MRSHGTVTPLLLLFLIVFAEAMDDCLCSQSLSSGLSLLQMSGNQIPLNCFPDPSSGCPQSRVDKRVQGSRKTEALPVHGCGNLEAHQAQALQLLVIGL